MDMAPNPMATTSGPKKVEDDARSTENSAGLQSIDCTSALTCAEQDAVNEVQGLLTGFGLLEELEGEDEEPDEESDEETDKETEVQDVVPDLPQSTTPFFGVSENPEVSAVSEISDHDIWAEVKDYFALPGDSAPWWPNFEAFLKQLRPYRDGRIECRACRQYRHCEIRPVWGSIKHHFWIHHVDLRYRVGDWDIYRERIGKVIYRLMRQPRNFVLVRELIQRCNEQMERWWKQQRPARETAYFKEKLPSIDIFLMRVQVTHTGLLLCGQLSCAETEEFSASPTELREHFISHHCPYLLDDELNTQMVEDVTHMMASWGTKYSVNQLIRRAKRQEIKWQSMDEDERCEAARLDEGRRNLRNIITRRLPGTRQWTVLQELRREFSKQHRKFRKLALVSGDPLVRSCAKRWRRPGGLLRLGILAFRDIILGHPPAGLKEVFSFISLSYAMTTVLGNHNIKVPFSPGVEDFWALRQAIQNEHKRHIFDRLLMINWPGDTKQLYTGSATRFMDSILDFSSTNFASPEQDIGNSLKRIVMRLFKAASADQTFKFSAFLDIDLHPTTQRPPDPLKPNVETDRSHLGSHSDGKGIVSKLRNSADAHRTAIFRRIHYFMIFISQYGIILIYFGDEERRYRLPVADSRTVTVREIIEAAFETVSSDFEPLHPDEHFSNMHTTFAAFDQVTEVGLIWCILKAMAEPTADGQPRFSHSPVSNKRDRIVSAQTSRKRHRGMDDSQMETSTSESERSAVRQPSCRTEIPSPTVEGVSCDVCPKRYYGPNSLNTLRRHKREQHSDSPRQYSCRFCSYRSKRRGNVDHHERMQHGR